MTSPSKVPLSAVVDSLSQAESVITHRKLPKNATTAHHFLQHLGQSGFQTAADVEKFLNSPAGKIVQAIFVRELAEEESEEEVVMQLYQQQQHDRQVAFTLVAHLFDVKEHQALIEQAIEEYNNKVLKQNEPHTLLSDSISIVETSVDALEISMQHLEEETARLDEEMKQIDEASNYSDTGLADCLNTMQEVWESFLDSGEEIIEAAIAATKLDLQNRPAPKEDETYTKVHKILDQKTLKEQFDPVKMKLETLECLKQHKQRIAPNPNPSSTPSLTPMPKFDRKQIKDLKPQALHPRSLGFSDNSPVFNLVDGLVKTHQKTSHQLDKAKDTKKSKKNDLEEAKKSSKERITSLKEYHEQLLDKFNRLGAQFGQAKSSMSPAPKHDDTASEEFQIRK